MKKSVLITGAAGGLGSAFARGLAEANSPFDLHLADRAEAQSKLEQVAEGVGATRVTIIDLFGKDAGERNPINGSSDDIIIWNAAVNVDHPEMPVDTRVALREQQNASMERLLNELSIPRDSAVGRRLLIVVNSVTALFSQNPKIADFLSSFAAEQNLHYGRMKTEQAAMLSERRDALSAANVDLSVLYPGSIDTGFTDVGHALKNANALGRKMKGQRGRDDWKQEAALNPDDIAASVSSFMRQWSETAELPENRQEWVILKPEDLAI